MDLIVWLAIGLGMDAFSASIAIGAQGVSGAKKWSGSMLVGLFHIIMPIIGILIGSALSHTISWVGIALLVAVGLQMIRSGMVGRTVPVMIMTWVRWVVFALGVSVDSLSVGVTLGTNQSETWIAVLLFGFFASVMTLIGLQIGQVLKHTVGRYSEVIGGSILIGIAIRMFVS
ncbi:manganese efflux pump MntP family protein [Jeotgalibacillus proteolyticus]|uniref:Manganese efflux pump MntP n=1 Tax=Jeotgalibacillus proteolyticus TaxID=2082395 RepID=A0A2S5G9G7_9BACL|nr:manganese efflux pump [Jeotgalibacillus proteolyticus]PPA69628.1 hypothetical protein C4B60_13855 [Jeotgalibacillus proteolyticus]